MKKLNWIVAALGIAALVVSCGGLKAPVVAPGQKIKLQIILDHGVDDPNLTEGQVNQRTQVGNWMERDIIKLANKAGFDAELIQNKDAYQYAEGKYLLVVKIVDYNPGAKAARMLVGMGAGAASLTVQAELYGEGDAALMSDAVGSGSGRDWNYCARACNEQSLKRAVDYLNTKHQPAE